MPVTPGYNYPLYIGGKGNTCQAGRRGCANNRGGWPNGGAASGAPGSPGASDNPTEGCGAGGGSTSIHQPNSSLTSGIIAGGLSIVLKSFSKDCLSSSGVRIFS